MRRVVVTGLGVVAPNGIGKDEFWEACLNGRSGVGPIRSFDASNHPVRIAAETPDVDLTDFMPLRHRKSIKILSRAMRFAVAAAGLAVRDSGLDLDHEHHERVGVVMGTGLIPMDLEEIGPALAASCDEQGRFQAVRLGERGQSFIRLSLSSSTCPTW